MDRKGMRKGKDKWFESKRVADVFDIQWHLPQEERRVARDRSVSLSEVLLVACCKIWSNSSISLSMVTKREIGERSYQSETREYHGYFYTD